MEIMNKIMKTAENLMMRSKIELDRKKKGAFAFEYIIVLVLMVVVIFGAWDMLGEAVMDRVADITDFMENSSI